MKIVKVILKYEQLIVENVMYTMLDIKDIMTHDTVLEAFGLLAVLVHINTRVHFSESNYSLLQYYFLTVTQF